MSANPLNLTTVGPTQNNKTVTMNNMTEALSQAITASLSIDLSAGNHSITQAEFTRYAYFITTGNAVSRNLTIYGVQRIFLVENQGSATLNIIRGSTTLTLAAGAKGIYKTDGGANDLVAVVTSVPSGVNDIPQELTFSGVISPAQLVANTNDWAPTGFADAVIIRADTDASRNLTGLTGGASGRFAIIMNVGANNLVLKAEDTNSSASNRFGMSADLTLSTKQMAILVYDNTSSRWRIAGGAGGGGASAFTGLSDTFASYSGHARKVVRVNAAETALEAFEIPYAIPIFVPGTMTNGELVYRFTAIEDFRIPSGASGSQAKAGVASTGNVAFDIKKNGADSGDITFNVSATGSYTVGSNIDFTAGDVLEVTGPATADGTLADVSITIKAQRRS